jgi:hypothetical protein
VQKPVIRELLPIRIETFEAITETDTKALRFFMKGRVEEESAKYIFEPSLPEVFESIGAYVVLFELY